VSTDPLTGIHHITAIAGDPQRNLDFYTQVLGLRMVKLTVNFDDPGTYHLYFGDEDGTPGSLLTFFPWPRAPRGDVGTGQVSAASFAVAPNSLEYWAGRLAEHGALPREEVRFGERLIRCADPDGLPLEFVGTRAEARGRPWSAGPVPAVHAVCGFHSATLSQDGSEPTARLLQMMGFRQVGTEGARFRYSASGARGAIIDVLSAPDGRQGTLGAGTVHHIAFRTSGDEPQLAWRHELSRRGLNVTPVFDRTYFHSIYFREPGGVLFEIATDPPGFAVDEPRDQLGEHLMLPKQLEPRREELERSLPPLSRRDRKGAGS
jgi:glyoxalase family protein